MYKIDYYALANIEPDNDPTIPLTLTASNGSVSVTLNAAGTVTNTYKYKNSDESEFSSYTLGTPILLEVGKHIQLKRVKQIEK